MRKINNQKGFTIIELSIATLVFSVLLAICMAAFLDVGRLFIKGANMSLTQQNARTITDSISNDIRFTQGTPQVFATGANAASPYFCVGLHRYKFNLGKQFPQSGTYGLVRQDVTGVCPDLTKNTPADGVTNPVEMLGNGMQLNELKFGPADNNCSGNLCTITINLLFYGADSNVFVSDSHPLDLPSDALLESDAHCAGSDLGTQFCATTSYTTSVLQSSLYGD